MDVHYLTFMGRNLENKKKMMPIQRMNSVGINNKNIVNSVNIFNVSVAMNSIFLKKNKPSFYETSIVGDNCILTYLNKNVLNNIWFGKFSLLYTLNSIISRIWQPKCT